jgi:perosamine synthetase
MNIPVNTPVLNGNEEKYVLDCLRSGWISSEGPYVERFEKEFARKIGRKYAIAVSNGSVALDVAIEAIGISKGDEVIMPTFTIISCISQIVRNGGVPVLVDCDERTWNMDVSKLESLITERTKAIMVVHIYGLPVDLDPIIKLCEKYNLILIEDAAEMHGQTYNNRMCGSFGDISTFSFYPNKHITTGEGGMILTDSLHLADKLRALRNLCFQPERRFIHKELGWNYRMSNIQAAIGVAQLERLDEIVLRKREIGSLYSSLLNDIEDIQLPLHSTNYADNIYWVFGVVIKDSDSRNAIDLMSDLAKMGVGTRPFFYPMHLQPVFRETGMFFGEKFPVSESICEKGFYLPSGLSLTDEEIIYVVNCLKSLFN